jgi:peptidoglycan/LPS O-acetylase OafA/YrhL
MGQSLTYVTELAVGLGCVVAAVATARSRRMRWLALVLAVAGATAIVHAIAQLATE